MKKFYLYDPTCPVIVECFFVGAIMFIDCFKGKAPIRLDRFGEHGPFDCMEETRLFEDQEEAEDYLQTIKDRRA